MPTKASVKSAPCRDYRVALTAAFGAEVGFGTGIAYLKSYAEKHLEEKADIRLLLTTDEILSFDPDLVGISSITTNFLDAIDIASRIREKSDALIVLGGYHITALPEELKYDCFDIGVRGEGEVTFTELLRALINNRPIGEIDGLVFKRGGKIVTTTPRKMIENINSIPYFWRDLGASSGADMLSARGCPYTCAYCSTPAFWERKYRFFDAEYMFNEVKWITQNSNVQYITFVDDLFIFPEERLRLFVELLETHGMLENLMFVGYVRANLLTRSCLELLKKLHVSYIDFGAESGSDRILKMYKPTASVEINQAAIDLCFEMGIPVRFTYMSGFPGETREDLLATVDFFAKNQHKIASDGGFFLFQPFPGTQVWNALPMETRRDIIDNQKWLLMHRNYRAPDFDWGNALYFNDALPREEFFEIISTKFPKFSVFNDYWLPDKYENDPVLNALKGMKYDGPVFLYGAGYYGEIIAEKLKAHYPGEIVAFLDKNHESKKEVCGIPVLSPAAALDYPNVKIIITPLQFAGEVLQNLFRLGISAESIINPFTYIET